MADGLTRDAPWAASHLGASAAAAQMAEMLDCPGCRADGPHCVVHRRSLAALATTVLHLEPLHAQRVRHSLTVADRAAQIADPIVGAGRIGPLSVSLWCAAGVLHDVGYGHPSTGHHGVDGARYLRGLGVPGDIVALVAWHSTSQFEVVARHLPVDLAGEFGVVDPLAHAVLWVADFTTSPQGVAVTVDERIDGLRRRHDADGPVLRALDAAEHPLHAAGRLVDNASRAHVA